ncbi:helix-turn-helix domain-containing protein [Bacillaceae bacterium SIJ1]|uniref:helix-turn-helix domain-containing protein n=1 Tax=Litoribacterium kuwaitense TaxID=1398745 RepID=UPI0013ED9011|nr:helix-turn-helix domain-containing protein [Litoribacterium kuwaitense]NGP44911.1 helix-turn-helix domain-containing protein [Litoribacterium kuwaitense]
MDSIGEKIKRQRKEKQLTQQDLADLLNVSRSAISNWESERNYPDLSTLVQLSDALDISLDQLLREDSMMVEEISKEQRVSQRRKTVLLSITPVLVISLVITFYFLYQDVRAFKLVFSPEIRTSVQIEEGEEGEWIEIDLGRYEQGEYIDYEFWHMKNPFWKKEIVNVVDNPSAIEVQIIDVENNSPVSTLTIESGTGGEVHSVNHSPLSFA